MALFIQYKNGLTDSVPTSDYTEYTYDGKTFSIFNNNQMIALINIDSVSGIFVKNDSELKTEDKTLDLVTRQVANKTPRSYGNSSTLHRETCFA